MGSHGMYLAKNNINASANYASMFLQKNRGYGIFYPVAGKAGEILGAHRGIKMLEARPAHQHNHS
jgi:hypothetical protein